MRVKVIMPVLAGVTDDYADQAIKSLRATTDWPIIVVRNGAAEPDRRFDADIQITTQIQGQCHAVNMGAEAAGDCDYLFIVNDDMYFAPDWKISLRFSHPVFSPNLLEPTNNRGSAAPFLKVDGGYSLAEFDKRLVDHFVAVHVREFQDALPEITEQPGFNFPFFIKKDLWDLIGGYDEAFDPWGASSDTDLQMKFELAGVLPVRLRDVLVYHFSNKSGTFDGTHQDFWQNNWEYIEDKWGFNRDEAHSDTWYHKNMIMRDKLKYHPAWEGKYEKS